VSPMEIAWTVVGIAVPLAITAGYNFVGLTPPEFRRARFCFILAAVILGGMEIVWYTQTGFPFVWRVIVATLICLTIGIGLPETLRWVHRRELLVARPPVSVPADQKVEPNLPTLTVTETSEIVARLYMRGIRPQPPATTGHYEPFLQEFFYDWILTLTPQGQAENITIIVKDPIKHPDHPKIEPDIASVSGPEARWMSGFEEPSRKPDYYERTIRFPVLEDGRIVRIVLRRPITLSGDRKTLELLDYSRSFEVTAEKCRVVTKALDDRKELDVLAGQLNALSKKRYSGEDKPPPAIRKNPNAPIPPLASDEVEFTLEVRCQDALCDKFTIDQLEAREGAP
jgi:hypothetical protein